MLNKSKAKTWVKVVAWGLALVFGTSFTLLIAMPAPRGGNTIPAGQPNSPASPSERQMTPISKSKSSISGLLGQGEAALKSGRTGDAVAFFEQALEKDNKSTEAREKLGDALFALGQKLTATDKNRAKQAFLKYLEVLPGGAHAAHVKSALKQLK